MRDANRKAWNILRIASLEDGTLISEYEGRFICTVFEILLLLGHT